MEMRILLLTAYFPPEGGSASQLFAELGAALVQEGHEVTVVTGMPRYHVAAGANSYRGRWYVKEKSGGMTVRRIGVFQVFRDSTVGRGTWQFSCAFSFMLAGLAVRRPDVVLVYSPPLPLAIAAWAVRVRTGSAVVINVQDLFPQSAVDLKVLRSRLLIRAFELLEKAVYRRADAITVHSSGNREHVVRKGGRLGCVHVVHNAVNVDAITPGQKENAIRAELGLQGRFIASFGGVMGHSQDLDVILEAAQLLERAGTRVDFLLVGDGVRKAAAVERARQMELTTVHWLPMLPHDRYALMVQASDVGLTTLRAFVKTPVVPSKILSVMAAGRPVVAAVDLGGDAVKLVAEAEAGICVPPENPAALADALSGLAHDPERCRCYGENGRAFAVKHLSTRAVAEVYSRIFSELAPAAKPQLN